MIHRAPLYGLVSLMLSSAALSAQLMGLGSASNSPTFPTPYAQPVQGLGLNQSLWLINGDIRSPLESPGGSLSKLDLKAPGKAKHEYDKGYQLLMRKDQQGAVQHLSSAIALYPSYVAAHNALGSAYLGLGQSDQARAEFAQAVALDDHLPTSYLNLGCAELALSHYPAAEDAIQKASNIAPLDVQLLTALAYGQFMNHDYAGVIATTHKVHEGKHDGAAMVHFFAAAAWGAQEKLPEAQQELLALLREDPKSPAAAQAVTIMEDMKREQMHPASSDLGVKISYTMVESEPTGPVEMPERIRRLLQAAKENGQIAEAEAALACATCADADDPAPGEAEAAFGPSPRSRASSYAGFTLHAATDEVSVFFAATDHGKPVTNLTRENVELRDKGDRPVAVTGFRSLSQLPLRLGLVIDTSSSVTDRFKFEQEAATNFMQKVVTGPNDLAFVIGFANSVLLVQDFTADQKLISHAVGQLAPSGGTALWDAVAFAANKLASRKEAEPVARVLVVISDGQDNSSSDTLLQAISRAQRGEVAIYTVSTREATGSPEESALVGEHALTTIAELTGGTDFSPGSVRHLDGSLVQLEQVIRSRYLISYKPAAFKRDGQYRAIDIQAEKDGRKLRAYARKGYYAGVNLPGADHF